MVVCKVLNFVTNITYNSVIDYSTNIKLQYNTIPLAIDL